MKILSIMNAKMNLVYFIFIYLLDIVPPKEKENNDDQDEEIDIGQIEEPEDQDDLKYLPAIPVHDIFC